MACSPNPSRATARCEPCAYLIGGVSVAADDARLQPLLAQSYGPGAAHGRPRCLCRKPHPELYISRIAGVFHLKRMPGTGGEHDPSCQSFEPPPELSGLGQVLGAAISEDPADGSTTLKLGFPLTKTGRRAASASEAVEDDDVTPSGARLTLRGLLHFLWEEAGFNRWTPAMQGKRNWGVVRRHLLMALDRKQACGAPLLEAVFIPEPWEETRKEEIAQRQRATLLRVASAGRGARRLLMLLGEVRLLEPGRYGHRLVLKHAPDVEFQLGDDLVRRLRRRFEAEFGFWEGQPGARDRPAGHLMAIGTFSVGLSGRPAIEALALMYVNPAWIPVEDAFDAEVIAQLIAGGVRFVRALRYNLPSTKPLACAVMLETAPRPTALYIVRPAAGEVYERLLGDIVRASPLQTWIWRVADGIIPRLPIVDRPGARPFGGPPDATALAFDPGERDSGEGPA
jgi:hypothetical protein